MRGKPANDNDACPSYGSANLQWEQDNVWIALVAAVWGWMLVLR